MSLLGRNFDQLVERATTSLVQVDATTIQAQRTAEAAERLIVNASAAIDEFRAALARLTGKA